MNGSGREVQRKGQIKEYIGYMSEDLQIATKFVGLRMQLLDYLGDVDGAQIEMDRYRRVTFTFFLKENAAAASLLRKTDATEMA